MIAHAVTPTQWALHEAKKARMARMALSASRVKANDNAKPAAAKALPKPEPKPDDVPPPVRTKREPLDITTLTRKQYARARAQQFGFTLDQIIKLGRRRDVIKVKHRIMYEMRVLYGASFPVIAEIFGLTDHSTVVSAVQKIDKGTPAVERKPIKRDYIPAHNRTPDHIRDEVVEMYRAGADNKAAIGRAFDISRATVLAILRERGEISR